MNTITGRCIWITGASSGLGKALSLQLAEAGNFVIASARSQSALANLAALYPGKIKALPLDVGRNLNLQQAANQVREITDYLDMVICAAGICEYEDDLNFNPDIYERTIDINFLGAVRIFNIALPLLKNAQIRPQFAVVSSLSTCVGFPRAEAYGASKAALNYFMQSLRADFSKIALDLSLIRPGFISTKLVKHNDFPMPFMMSPETAAKRIIKKLGERRFAIDFPHRLSWPLQLWGHFSGVWCKWVAPKLTRLHQW
ncbi:short-chain dehydrogenase [Cellvibrio zantedeschiae]|uniref:Short-chain dehydrogenase n=1 Tax=Cellvibrio zantedeschiae TaxID=1237077 RepID=A0ABQ3B6C0_9GAMM|nr:SDR family NAD(P)-dependent oxidoreductase [Cellvibrio zantedeschiae]GGY75426.1 short-chain dehydrogenase [Cellvibrio zantedeschiae]